MQKKIVKVSSAALGHLHLTFEDGSMAVVHRGKHEEHDLKPGKLWPPKQLAEASN
jgi:hypothetical protein